MKLSPLLTQKCLPKVCELCKSLTPLTPAPKPDYSIANPAVFEKYKTAGGISNKVIAEVRAAVKNGAKIFDLCQLGDNSMTEELSKIYSSKKSKVTKGIAFPTCVNPNNIVGHFSPESAEDVANLELKDGDVVSIMLGVQVDGFPAIVAETVVVGESKESPVTGKKADVVAGAWNASEAAIRAIKTGGKNWDVTNVVDKVTKDFGVCPVSSMLSHNQERNLMYGPKEIILNPTKEHKSKVDNVRFEELEVYGLDILVSTSADGKVKDSDYKTTLHKLTGNSYSLKLKSSHQALNEFKSKVTGLFPANVKIFENPRKVRVGLIECSNHEVILPYDIMEDKAGEYVAQYFTTVAITRKGLVQFTNPSFEAAFYNTDKKVQDEELASTIAAPLPRK